MTDFKVFLSERKQAENVPKACQKRVKRVGSRTKPGFLPAPWSFFQLVGVSDGVGGLADGVGSVVHGLEKLPDFLRVGGQIVAVSVIA